MSESGKNRWKNLSEEEKKIRNLKISKSKIGIKRDEEVREKISNSLKGREISKETIKKIIKKNKGKKRSNNFKKEQSERFKGSKNPMFSRKQSEIFIQNRRDSWLGEKNPNYCKVFSDETRRKMSESRKGRPSKNKDKKRKMVKCPYCNKMGGIGVMNRWHFENCKFK